MRVGEAVFASIGGRTTVKQDAGRGRFAIKRFDWRELQRRSPD